MCHADSSLKIPESVCQQHRAASLTRRARMIVENREVNSGLFLGYNDSVGL